DTLENHSELMISFFQSDFELVLNKLKTTNNQDDFVDYVTALHDDRNRNELENNRKDIRQNDDLLTSMLDPLNSPKGKWPSKHSPVLMQQLAINAYLQQEGKIFSVNGPPGTGKTTLLKELIAHNVVERAAILAEYKNADDAFNTISFKDGSKKYRGYDNEFNHFYGLKNDKINDFNLLVASSNNAAVENITKELPDYTSLMDGIDSKETSEIKELFNQRKQETELSFRVRICDKYNKMKIESVKRKDIYFTLLAHLLKHNNDNLENKETLSEWGLISAPLGKRANLSNYFYQVIMPIINYKTSSKKDNQAEFEKVKNKFKKQYQKVQDMQQVLHEISKFKNRKNLNRKPLSRKEKSVFEDIKKYLENIDYLKKKVMVVDYELRQLLPTLKHDYFQFEREKSKLVFLKKDTSILQEKILETTKEIANLEVGKKFHEKVFNRFLKTQRLVGIRQLEQALLDLREYEKSAIITERKQGGIIAYQKETLLEQEQYKVNLENKSQKYHSDIGLYEKQIQIKQSELTKLQAESEAKREKVIADLEKSGMVILNDEFLSRFHGKNTTIELEAQLANPWITREYDREREKLFYLALQVNKYFILTSEKVKSNLVNLGYLWNFKKNSDKEFCYFSERDRKNCFKELLNTIFLLTPVISTTFASVSRFLADVEEPESLGQLIIDEAGQATPHMAVGALWRFKKAIVVGDPKQVEPVVTEDVKLLLELFAKEEFSWYKSRVISVQTFADSVNYIGSFLSSNDRTEKQWVGCPLVIHRRCLNPMFSISNELAYNNTMLFQTAEPKEAIEKNLVESNSLWISIDGNEIGNKNHHVPEQVKKAVMLVEKAFEKQEGQADMYIISPFTSVIRGFVQEAKKSSILKKYAKATFESWLNTHCGTVHKFQGKEAGEVIFLLGCDASAMGAVNWVNENIVNVAVTRAKYRLYVIGDANVWKKNSSLLVLQNRLEKISST
ncbi:DNA helicase, partial [Listeria monocytogenes]|nr:DNA helicase [Listeria monocytogenes]